MKKYIKPECELVKINSEATMDVMTISAPGVGRENANDFDWGTDKEFGNNL